MTACVYLIISLSDLIISGFKPSNRNTDSHLTILTYTIGRYLQRKSSLIIVPISGIKFVEINFCTPILRLISSKMIVDPI